MPEFYVEVSAGVRGVYEREIVKVEQEHEPTDEEMEAIYKDLIANLLDSGYALVTKEDYEDYLENG